MAGQYSPRSFLRRVPNHLLRQYLERQGLANGISWDGLGETDIAPIFQAVESASEKVRLQIERDFGDIHDMATEGGTKVIVEEARFPAHGLELGDTLSSMDSHEARAFWTFLNHERVFMVARRFSHADNLSSRSWRKRGGLPRKDADISDTAKDTLAHAISAYYRSKEGRGHVCVIDHYKRGDRLYWFAYPEDYAGASMEYTDEGEFQRRILRPAFEVIFVHSPAEGSLDIFAKGPKGQVDDLQLIWGRAILRVDLPELRAVDAAYELNPLKNPKFPFKTDPADGIQDVRVKRMRLSFLGNAKQRIVLEADVRKDRNAVYKLLEQVLASKDLPSVLMNVTQVRLQFMFRPTDADRSRTLNCDISYPNSCNLKYDPKHEIAKKYLKEWGIDVSGRADTDTETS